MTRARKPRPPSVTACAPVMVPIDSVTTHPRNPRIGDVDAIAQSMLSHGQYVPILVQRSTGHVLVGNHRLLALHQLGAKEVWASQIDVDDDRAHRIMLADNRTSDLGDYDYAELVDLLRDLDEGAAEIVGTGYSADDLAELITMLDGAEAQESAPAGQNQLTWRYLIEIECADEARQIELSERLNANGVGHTCRMI